MSRIPLLLMALLMVAYAALQAPTIWAQGTFSPSMRPARWQHGSVPSAGDVVDGRVEAPIPLLEIPGRHNAEVHWYSPRGVVKDSDLDPLLTNERGAQNLREVLAISVPRRPITATTSDTLWISLTSVLDPSGLDLSRVGAIEFWVNDWRDGSRVRGPGLKLHVDLGHVSEDQHRAPNVPPNRRLDSEDRWPRDNYLVVTDQVNEDTGFDNVLSASEAPATAPDLTTVTGIDPEGDDFGGLFEEFAEIDPRRWVRTNGTEGNGKVLPLPETEDLNLNDYLDTHEHYFRYTIDLRGGSQRYLVSDVYEAFTGQAVPNPPGPENGWRRYRIPLDDPARVQFGLPDLSFTRHLRIWVDGILSPDAMDAATQRARPLLMLAGIERSPDPRERIGSGAPNPFLSSTTFAYRLKTPAHVRAVVLDVQGREVALLDDGHRDAGYHAVVWNGQLADTGLAPAGVYFVRMRIQGGGDRLWRVVRLN